MFKKDPPATLVEYVVSVETLAQWREQRLALYDDEVLPQPDRPMAIRVVFKGTARHTGHAEAFWRGPDSAGEIAWIAMSTYGLPISEDFAVSVAARELARDVIARRGTCRELANGALLVDLGTL